MTHEYLRKRAVQWLTYTKHCGAVISEMVSAARETPDAVGWNAGFSILVECKVSRSDFFANKEKWFNRIGKGIGRRRYFLCPKDLLKAEDVAGSDYGLLWLHADDPKHPYVRVVVDAPIRESDLSAEVDMLVSALRRVKVREFLILVPDAINSETRTETRTEGAQV